MRSDALQKPILGIVPKPPTEVFAIGVVISGNGRRTLDWYKIKRDIVAAYCAYGQHISAFMHIKLYCATKVITDYD